MISFIWSSFTVCIVWCCTLKCVFGCMQFAFKLVQFLRKLDIAGIYLTLIRWLQEIDSLQWNSYYYRRLLIFVRLALYFRFPFKPSTKFIGNIYKQAAFTRHLICTVNASFCLTWKVQCRQNFFWGDSIKWFLAAPKAKWWLTWYISFYRLNLDPIAATLVI